MKTPSEKSEQQKLAQAERSRQRLEKRASDERVREQFKSFFIKLDKPNHPKSKNDENKAKTESFAARNFALKKDMRVAPMLRRCGFSSVERQRFEKVTASQNVNTDNLYLNEIKTRKRRPHRLKPDRTVQHLDDRQDVLLVDEEVVAVAEESAMVGAGTEKSVPSMHKNPRPKRRKNSHRGKLLQFAENYRPPYYGTWRKRCKSLNGRRPFKRAYEHFDYDLDSDAEWEEEPPDADECKSDDEEDCGTAGQENNEEDDEDDGFFVEHGYLSPDEEDVEKTSNDDDDSDKVELDPEARRLKMKIRAETWKSEKLCRKWEPLKPVCILNPVTRNRFRTKTEKEQQNTDPPLTLKPHFAERLKTMRAIIIEPIIALSQNAALPVTPKNQQKVQKRKSTEKPATGSSAQKSASKSSYKRIDTYCTASPPAAKLKRMDAPDHVTTQKISASNDAGHVTKINVNHVTVRKSAAANHVTVQTSVADHHVTTQHKSNTDHVIQNTSHMTHNANHVTTMTAVKDPNNISVITEKMDTTECNKTEIVRNNENDVICLDL